MRSKLKPANYFKHVTSDFAFNDGLRFKFIEDAVSGSLTPDDHPKPHANRMAAGGWTPSAKKTARKALSKPAKSIDKFVVPPPPPMEGGGIIDTDFFDYRNGSGAPLAEPYPESPPAGILSDIASSSMQPGTPINDEPSQTELDALPHPWETEYSPPPALLMEGGGIDF